VALDDGTGVWLVVAEGVELAVAVDVGPAEVLGTALLGTAVLDVGLAAGLSLGAGEDVDVDVTLGVTLAASVGVAAAATVPLAPGMAGLGVTAASAGSA
jgi:hypothetical protein